MKSLDALKVLAGRLGDALVVCCNGFPSRELYLLGDRPEHFYMIGSMGLAAPIGMGVALARPGRRVVVLDGDGNALMALGAMANVGAARPENLVHVILDNGTYASTGAQRTVSRQVALERVAASCGYAEARRVADPEALLTAWTEIVGRPGPSCLLVEVEPTSGEGLPRVEITPPALAGRFREAV